ncbi:hypothetical protein cyc_05561 [Cyclospora cayetanensis]|uniref:Uncharacterized protein n=1 Tax=Cyclospora cayetanensis TaxID=88456 RepID=A0A1D3D3W1_9EIME|nr:hypothetical protein cyc_05561 [Cyclospora cayetanensis]
MDRPTPVEESTSWKNSTGISFQGDQEYCRYLLHKAVVIGNLDDYRYHVICSSGAKLRSCLLERLQEMREPCMLQSELAIINFYDARKHGDIALTSFYWRVLETMNRTMRMRFEVKNRLSNLEFLMKARFLRREQVKAEYSALVSELQGMANHYISEGSEETAKFHRRVLEIQNTLEAKAHQLEMASNGLQDPDRHGTIRAWRLNRYSLVESMSALSPLAQAIAFPRNNGPSSVSLSTDTGPLPTDGSVSDALSEVSAMDDTEDHLIVRASFDAPYLKGCYALTDLSTAAGWKSEPSCSLPNVNEEETSRSIHASCCTPCPEYRRPTLRDFDQERQYRYLILASFLKNPNHGHLEAHTVVRSGANKDQKGDTLAVSSEPTQDARNNRCVHLYGRRCWTVQRSWQSRNAFLGSVACASHEYGVWCDCDPPHSSR